MANVRKRGKSYQITVSNGRRADGSQILETATFTPEPSMTPKQIEKALEQFQIDFERKVKSGQNIKGERMTLQQLAELFLSDNQSTDTEDNSLSVVTYIGYKNILNLRIIPHLGHMKITNITAKTIKDYSKELRKDGSRKDGKRGALSESTITKDCAIISSLLSYAVGEGLLPINPLIYIGRQGKGRKAKKEYKVSYFTIEQTKRFLWALDNPIPIHHTAHTRIDDTGKQYFVPDYEQVWTLPLKWRAYFYLALFVGDRRGENIALTWKDINFENGEVNIDKSTVYVEGELIQKSTKTYKSRTPIVPPVVIAILRQWKIEQMHICLERGTYWQGYTGKEFDKNFIFTQENGKQMHPSSPYHQFKRIIRIYNENIATSEAEQIPPNATQHDLRHTAASILIANNMDPRSVAGVLGHANASTTLNIYSYFFQSKTKEAANILSNVLEIS